ncbi:hypothetical protein [Companilactobacillus kimchii]|uniref:hypothetical protein n=1 Tax=Companilactobacillus kimchii TaxID=2801452 RepID=UPI000B2AA5A7|nr:hypothetical protein [Companilactobacillus kimchii]
MVEVKNPTELIQALTAKDTSIVLTRSMMLTQSITLPDAASLSGKPQEDSALPILMFQDSDGVGLTSNNTVENLIIHVPTNHRSIFNTNYEANLGSFNFENLELNGQFSFLSKTKLNNTLNLKYQYHCCRH